MPDPEILDLPPAEAIESFRAKGYHIGWDWRDTDAAQHARSFTVARAARLDLLEDIRGAVDRAMAEGRTLAEFTDELEPLLRRKGWWGRQVIVGPDGAAEMVQLGSLSRLRTILDTNLRMSLARGRWQRIERRAARRPWLRYVATLDDRTRPAHRAWHGTVLPHDHPFWASHYPPNGWHCRCTVLQLSDRDLERYGYSPSSGPPSSAGRTREWTNQRTGEVSRVPVGIDPGFEFNAGRVDLGADAANRLVQAIDGAPPALARAAIGTPWRSDRFRRFVRGAGPDAARSGDWPIAVAGQAVLTAIAARAQTVRLSDGTAARQRQHHPDVAAADYARAQRLLDEGELFRSRHHRRAAVAFGEADGRTWRAVVKATEDGSETYLQTLHQAQPHDLEAARRRLERIDREGGVRGAGRGAIPALARRHEVLAGSGATAPPASWQSGIAPRKGTN